MSIFKLSHKGETIDETLYDAARSCRVTYGQNGIMLLLEANNGQRSVAVNPVTNTTSGVMTPSLLKRLSDVEGKVDGLKTPIDECVANYSLSGVTMSFKNDGKDVFSIDLGVATPSRAGLMSPVVYNAIEQSAIVYAVNSVSGVDVIESRPYQAGYSGVLCYDTSIDQLLLFYMGGYYKYWNVENYMGLDHTHFQRAKAIISVEGKFFSYNATKGCWVNVGTGESSGGNQGGGGGGEDLHVTIEHSVNEAEWTVIHNLGKRPSVTITTYEGVEVVGEVKYIDNNTIKINFGNPMTGYVILN